MVHLPAVNTPQFDWCQTTRRRHPQPVPPIYQPEVAADAIVEAALEGRCSKARGSWNKMLVVAGQIAPGLGNQYSARAAWDSQMAVGRIDSDRPDNLHRPADGDRDASSHGIFDGRARGVRDPRFLESLPGVARTLAAASIATVRDHYRRSPP